MLTRTVSSFCLSAMVMYNMAPYHEDISFQISLFYVMVNVLGVDKEYHIVDIEGQGPVEKGCLFSVLGCGSDKYAIDRKVFAVTVD